MATSTTTRRLVALVHEYAREPAPVDPDAPIRRDLAYFDRLLILLSQQDESAGVRGRALATGAGQYRVRWSIDVDAGGAVDAARQARRIQLQPTSLATAFEVARHDGVAAELDWGLAETIDLGPHPHRRPGAGRDPLASYGRRSGGGRTTCPTSPNWSG